jgi:hypothetical protein
MDPPSTETVTVWSPRQLTMGSYAAHQKQSSLSHLKIICSGDLA